ncbi:general stress protein [Bacillus sp. FJAT-22090]|uniref:general stress protein n=1 Tax=Bacillus sp. FJAT-22090 TaxID=1581038 RepID=UPI0016433C49|nr:general stress protein [Bacillus sp. FJAT-22090]
MNIESNRRIEIARSEEEMYEKLELLQEQGYAENDIHVISKENAHLYTLNRHSEVSTHEAGTFMDKFKSWFTGEDAITEGLRKLDLSEEETERYAQEVAGGGIVLYTDVLTFNDDPLYGSHENEFNQEYTDTVGTDIVQNRFMEVEEPISDYSKKQGFTPSTNEFVNETDGRFDEPEDRFVRGETFATDPYLAREENHIGHSMQEDKMVRQQRPTTMGDGLVDEEEFITPEQYEERRELKNKVDSIPPPINRIY